MNGAADTAAQRLGAELAGQGWGIDHAFLPASLVAALRSRIGELDAAGAFRPAAVGAGAARAVRPAVRGDRLCWLEPPATADERLFLGRIEALRLALNGRLQLGLFDFECQYAIYGPGARYARHLDRSPAGAERVVSVVAYLNDGWTAADRGELQLYVDSDRVTVAPAGGTLVIFESARFEHEVCPASRERFSIAGWYRRRARVPAPV